MITTLSLSPAVDKIYYVENFKAGGLYRVKHVIKSAGGKGINVARVSAILGEKVRCLGFKAGNTGDWLEAETAKLGVETEFISVEGESRTNNNIIDRASGLETEVLEEGPLIGDTELKSFLSIFLNSLKGTNILVCSGGLPKGIGSNFYRELITLAGNSDIKVILDTNGEILEEGIKAKPFLIKPNKRELSKLVARTLSSQEEIIDACRYVISKGVEYVAASIGEDGALLVSKDKVLYAKPPHVQVQNTIGSGDSLVSGIAAGLSRGKSAEDAFKLGMACSVANTQFENIGYVTLELVDKYLKEIEITEIQ